jgi:type I restriction enzyme S subunit
MTGTSGRQRVPAECFSSYLLAVPPQGIVAAFGTFAEAALRVVKQHDGESSTLIAIRDALLPKLLSGEIRARDAEHELEAVL